MLELLNDVGLRPEQADLFPHEFSGGQRQRIAMASALSVAPALIVLDEPVSALDVSVQAQIMNLLRDLQVQHDVSYLMVSHNLATVRYLAHEVAVMYLGEIVERAATDDLYEHPLHPYTQALFSAALPAHPALQRDEIVLQGEAPSPLEPAVRLPLPPALSVRERRLRGGRARVEGGDARPLRRVPFVLGCRPYPMPRSSERGATLFRWVG